MLDKKITHSIYLIKSEFVENENFLQGTENCQQYSIPIAGYPNATAYLKTTPSMNWRHPSIEHLYFLYFFYILYFQTRELLLPERCTVI